MFPHPFLAIATGALLIAVAIPLLRRRVKPNWWYGLRVPATFADEWVWYEANAKTGRDLIVLGVGVIVVGLVLQFFPDMRDDTRATLLGFALAVGAVALVATGWTRANRLLREHRNKS